MKTMRKVMMITTLAAMMLSSCASIFCGSKKTVLIESEPSGAHISINGIDKGVTPAPVKLKRGNEGQIITLKLDGYKPKVFQPETGFNAVTILNGFNLLGYGIDALTGAMWKYDSKFYTIELEKE